MNMAQIKKYSSKKAARTIAGHVASGKET